MEKKENEGLFDGSRVMSVRGRGTMYDADCMIVGDANKKTEYLINGEEIRKMMSMFRFRKEKKKIHTYLYVEEVYEDSIGGYIKWE